MSGQVPDRSMRVAVAQDVGPLEAVGNHQRLIVEQKKWVDDSGVGDRPNARQ